MKFSIVNIGAIDSATIEIDGITIIAGENNIGKSTIGKALFAFLRNMSEWKKIYDAVCNEAIKKFLHQNSVWLEDFCMNNSGAKRRRTSKTDHLISQYASDPNFRVALEDFQIQEESADLAEARKTLYGQLRSFCLEYLSLYFNKNKDELFRIYEIDLTGWLSQALSDSSRLNLDEVELQQQYVKISLVDVFKNQYRKFGTEKSKIVFIDEENREVQFEVEDAGEQLDNPIRVDNNIYFVETPKIYDCIANAKFGTNLKDHLRRMMIPNTFSVPMITPKDYNGADSTVDIVGTDLKAILEHLTDVMGGQAEFYQKSGLMFKDRFLDVPIKAVNVSAGLKSIALLEYALRIGAIERGDILILDEPEINLHPEWQLEYAKAIVELQKYYDIKFIIASHSPFFMRSIECYTDINDTMDKLNVYRVCCPDENGVRNVMNVSYSEYGVSDLYEDLSAPLDKLDALLNEKYGVEDGE